MKDVASPDCRKNGEPFRHFEGSAVGAEMNDETGDYPAFAPEPNPTGSAERRRFGGRRRRVVSPHARTYVAAPLVAQLPPSAFSRGPRISSVPTMLPFSLSRAPLRIRDCRFDSKCADVRP